MALILLVQLKSMSLQKCISGVISQITCQSLR